ncbi:hypothetical protein K1514_00970 [Paraclostridium bifermentans]|uniref:Uncharacterized protein n=1 Tax=Paraclostridium bifermentans TaxID=1490 RepID=A0AA44IHM5_PARBF|nr:MULTISPECIES: hypothetical protein [Paraclostridium]MBN8047444.1 hypothetical protein [Paraclostridium bifermentans]MBZ6004451.1 hypothetical protein [Paraclostridium bifermentans]MDU0296306.1 hypothetical protein [Paraclostridium sp. MRS3W1]NME09953.1 hypothetical protein [Paraclostridium bifermentans]
MVTLGCILIGLGLGLTLGNMQETIILSVVGLIVGAFLYTRMAVYIPLKFNKFAKIAIYITTGALIGVLVGVITGHIPGAIMIGVGTSFVAIDMMNYRRYRRGLRENNHS